MKPFVKWAGGKRQILKRINEFIDDSFNKDSNFTYLEPFIGGGAVFFDRKPYKAIINDLNEDLINVYRVIQSDQYEELIKLLDEHAEKYRKDPDDYYYEVRAWDRNQDKWPNAYTDVERAARMIFLNKMCYNGLYRVNNKGQFNTPIGRYHNPLICDRENLIEIHNYLSSKENNIRIMCGSYEKCIELAKDGDVIYLDPPYDYEDDDGFTKYQMSGFTFDNFKELKNKCDKALDSGAFVIISNNATQKVIKLFEQDPKYKIFYDINKFSTLRSINCNSAKRRTGNEVIFWGMDSNIPFPQANDMKKIIKLLMSRESVINDKDKAMKLIDVKTTRQVAYYLSALRFLNYLKHDKTFTDKANNLMKDERKIINDIYKQLLNDETFGKVYKQFKNTKIIDFQLIEKEILKNKKLSESTVKRRISTIKSWVEWMDSVSDCIDSLDTEKIG